MAKRGDWVWLGIEAVVIVMSILVALAIAHAYGERKRIDARTALPSEEQWDNSPSMWRKSGATTTSLRAGGGYLVSSDAIEVDDEKTALITYWIGPEGTESQDVYRCVDIVAKFDFSHAAQKCWKVLRAGEL